MMMGKEDGFEITTVPLPAKDRSKFLLIRGTNLKQGCICFNNPASLPHPPRISKKSTHSKAGMREREVEQFYTLWLSTCDSRCYSRGKHLQKWATPHLHTERKLARNCNGQSFCSASPNEWFEVQSTSVICLKLLRDIAQRNSVTAQKRGKALMLDKVSDPSSALWCQWSYKQVL